MKFGHVERRALHGAAYGALGALALTSYLAWRNAATPMSELALPGALVGAILGAITTKRPRARKWLRRA